MTPVPYSIATLAERWGCSKQHILDLIVAGDLKAFRLGAKLLRIAAQEVDRWESGAGATTGAANTGSASSRARAARSGMTEADVTATALASVKKSRRDLRLMRSLDAERP